MLSICIPVFDYDVQQLVGALHRQAMLLEIEFEILVYDDASGAYFQSLNRGCEKWDRVQYRVLEKNLGRSRIRNLMADHAQYDHILFLDCDLQLPSDAFLANYIQALKQTTGVICGGHIYGSRPEQKKLVLHWYYGQHREVRPIAQRKQKPYDSFMTGSFLAPKTIFRHIRFEESLRLYGHEDTLFGYELKKQAIPIVHIDNPVVHCGLDDAGRFLEKTRQSVDSLLHIHRYSNENENMPGRIKLWATYRKLQKMKACLGVRKFFGIFRKPIERRLLSAKPCLILLDFYKLGYLCDRAAKQNT